MQLKPFTSDVFVTLSQAKVVLSRRVELLQAVKAKIAKLQGKAHPASSLFSPKSNWTQRACHMLYRQRVRSRVHYARRRARHGGIPWH